MGSDSASSAACEKPDCAAVLDDSESADCLPKPEMESLSQVRKSSAKLLFCLVVVEEPPLDVSVVEAKESFCFVVAVDSLAVGVFVAEVLDVFADAAVLEVLAVFAVLVVEAVVFEELAGVVLLLTG
jgi:hypothetical protein